jgi:hypothetical protein
LSLEFELEGHGVGKVIAIFARRQAAKEVPESHQKLKALLESGATKTAG